jgi:hypothetical protein
MAKEKFEIYIFTAVSMLAVGFYLGYLFWSRDLNLNENLEDCMKRGGEYLSVNKLFYADYELCITEETIRY